MDLFPDSLLIEIFAYLNYEDLCLGVRPTCKRWRRLTHDATLWRNVQIADHFTDSRFLLLLQQPFVHSIVEGLECSKCENLTAESFDKLADLELPKLRTLSVPLISAFPVSIYAKLAKSCPGLQELENLGAKPDESIQPLHIQMMFPELNTLHDKPISSYGRLRRDMSMFGNDKRNRWLNDLAEVALQCSNIHTYHCRRGLEYVNDDGLEKISVLFPNLKKVELGYCSISDEGLRLFFQNNQCGLKELILDKPGDITDEGLKVIADHCPQLVNLKASRCLGVTNVGVIYLAKRCRKLAELHLNNTVFMFEEEHVKKCDFSNECVQSLAVECPDMIYLRMFCSDKLDSAGLRSLAQNCILLQGLMLYECPQIDDNCLAEMAKMQQLRAVVLVGCNNMTPAGLIDFVLLVPRLLRLTMFSNLNTQTFFGDMSHLADVTYAKISDESAGYLPSPLKKITVKGVGGPFLQLLTVLCPELHTLDLRDGCIVNNISLGSIIRNCENLKVLDVQNLDTINDHFIDVLCEHALKLRKLGLGQAVRHLSNTALAELISTCPSLMSVSMDTKGTDVDEDLLMDIARAHHGGKCFLHVDYECRQPDNYLEEHHRLIDLHFTPIKYLSSVTGWAGI